MSLNEVITRFYCVNAMERARETSVREVIAEAIQSGNYPSQGEFWQMVGARAVPEGERILNWSRGYAAR